MDSTIATLPQTTTSPTASRGLARSLAIVRITLGWIFLWAFIDKTLGLGFGTPADQSWMNGASPTAGYLASRDGTFAGLFHDLADNPWAEWSFMGGLAGLGLALTLGIGLRLAAIGGSLLMLTMWMSMIPLHDNPVIDNHIIYALTIIALAVAHAGDTWGLGTRWKELPLVRRLPILR